MLSITWLKPFSRDRFEDPQQDKLLFGRIVGVADFGSQI